MMGGGFHNARAVETDAIASKPTEFKVKLEVHLRIENRLVHCYVAKHA
jgi:hypothetical protein